MDIQEHIEYCRGLGMDDEEIAYAVLSELANESGDDDEALAVISINASLLVFEFDLDPTAVADARTELLPAFL